MNCKGAIVELARRGLELELRRPIVQIASPHTPRNNAYAKAQYPRPYSVASGNVMSSAPFMQLYVADYLADTQHLSLEQNGAYILLLMAMWRSGGSLPDDDVRLRRTVRATAKQWSRIRDDVLAFFDVADGVITQKRLSKEFTKAVRKSELRAAAGSRGGKAKSLKDNETFLANATVLPQHSSDIRYQNTDIRKKEEDNSLRSLAPQAASKRKVGSRLPTDWALPKSWGQWALDEVQGTSVEFIRSQADQFKDYWTSKTGSGATKMDWEATWRNWMRTAVSRMPKARTQQLKGMALVDQQLREEIENERNGSAESSDTQSLPRLSLIQQR